ncbi:cytochrome d ubiquinol oxidase subunit II [Streptomyces sp. NPDC048441]|uniref:cytochrome d ubiquinol oxidase subunit II n=1 Tax=Streptomyces sp. NPDC048441 TaxID=3365552 RepID=UPI0037233B3A
MWDNIWYALLALLLTGYLVLDGITIGSGIVGRLVARTDADRRTVDAATGPFFLGNEVWLVAAAGITLGGFPGLESTVVSGMAPLIVVAVAALLLRHAAIQFRRRVPTPGWRQRWDAVVQAACVALALMWGALGGAVLGALPVKDGHLSPSLDLLLRPVPVVSALTAVAVLALHGAVFLARRTTGPVAERAAELTSRLGIAAAGLGLLTLFAATFDARTRDGVPNAIPAVLIAAAAIAAALLAARLVASDSAGAPLFSGLAACLPVLAIGLGRFPQTVMSTYGGEDLSLAEAAAHPDTLSLVGPVMLLVLPVLLAFQAMQWWAFRTRTDERSPVYF